MYYGGAKMTNREWLNSLSDEEFAKYLSIVAQYGNDLYPTEICAAYLTATDEFSYEFVDEFESWLKGV